MLADEDRQGEGPCNLSEGTSRIRMWTSAVGIQSLHPWPYMGPETQQELKKYLFFHLCRPIGNYLIDGESKYVFKVKLILLWKWQKPPLVFILKKMLTSKFICNRKWKCKIYEKAGISYLELPSLEYQILQKDALQKELIKLDKITSSLSNSDKSYETSSIKSRIFSMTSVNH